MSSAGAFETDLVVLAADKTFGIVVSELLERPQSLGIRPISRAVFTHPHQDTGCLGGSAEYLSQFLPTHSRAIVLFDRHGCGQETVAAPQLEEAVRGQLSRSGWQGRAEAVVVDPELDVWVWSDSPVVARCLGWEGRTPSVRQWLQQRGLWRQGAPKPTDPKEAMKQALREVHKPRASHIYAQLARSVGLSRCTDRAFVRFREILQRWFPEH